MKELPKFLSAYEGRKEVATPSGEKLETTYEYNKEGTLVISGEKDIYEPVQQWKEETMIENMLARAAAGDNTVFRPDGIYHDTTEIPKSFHEQMDMINNIPEMIETAQKEAKEYEQEHGITLQEHTGDRNQTIEIRNEPQPQDNI